MPESYLDHNAAASARLRALVAGLSADDLGRRSAAAGRLRGEEGDDAVNAGLGPLLPTVDRASAGRLAIEAAAAVDAAVARLDDAQAQVLASGPNAYLMLRHYHRDEHIEQIGAALGE